MPRDLNPAVGGEVKPSDVALIWPTGEKYERAWLAALHDRGAAARRSERTSEEETRYRELVATYGDPVLHTIEWYSRYLYLDDLGNARTDEEEAEYLALGRDTGFDGADLTPEKVQDLEEKVADGWTLVMSDRIALDAAYRRSRARNRTDRRWMKDRTMPELLFGSRRPPAGSSPRRHAIRAPRSRRTRSNAAGEITGTTYKRRSSRT